MLPKVAACALLLGLVGAATGVHYHYEPQNRRSFDALPSSRRGGGDGFDPDMLNRFLEEYASKIKRTTEQPAAAVAYHDDESKANHAVEVLDERNSTDASRDEPSQINDTAKRHKFYNGNSHKEDRNNGGWVTLEAIPWSKSKISKWQANPTTQHPWPSDAKPWADNNKPSYNKPWDNDFPSRPASYENNKPWPGKPQWNDNTPAPSNKPWYSDRPRPGYTTVTIDKYEDPNQAQKWPPERPSWDKYADSSRPSADIITDNGPSNFPNNDFHRPAQAQRPSYSHHTESYVNEHGGGGWHDRNDFPVASSNNNNNNNNNNKFNRPNENYDDNLYDRPHFSHYNYPTRSDHPSNYPSTSDGQWVLLSTNRGYSKSRQRSIKFDATTSADANNAKKKQHADNEEEQHVPAVTSKRQIRLTVLPSINGTNTTTSHGGLLEVEKTFKTVDQSQKEYEAEKINIKANSNNAPNRASLLLNNNNRRPIRAPIISAGAPSSSAVLAAVGAGMLPATMAMMLPIMLGRRKKRSIDFVDDDDAEDDQQAFSFVKLPRHVFLTGVRRM